MLTVRDLVAQSEQNTSDLAHSSQVWGSGVALAMLTFQLAIALSFSAARSARKSVHCPFALSPSNDIGIAVGAPVNDACGDWS